MHIYFDFLSSTSSYSAMQKVKNEANFSEYSQELKVPGSPTGEDTDPGVRNVH